MEEKKDKKIRILALCDTPTGATGFSQVSKNIFQGLMKTGKYEIDIIGINFSGDAYDKAIHPYNIYPAMPQGYGDIYGRARFLNAINANEERYGLKPGWDIVFTIQDPFIIEGLGLGQPFAESLKTSKELWKRTVPPFLWFKWIAYFPVDSDLKENWVTRSIALPDLPVAYCDWGKEQILKFDRKQFETHINIAVTTDGEKKRARLLTPSIKERIEVIHHGVDMEVFKPLSEKEKKEFRAKFFKGIVKPDTFLIINVSRNQPRKDLTRTLKVFSEFKKQVPNSHLYLHCKTEDAGGSINEMARNFNLVVGKDYTTPLDFEAGLGYPVETVNKLYNIADLCMTTTLGEGWGFITTEAMATKTPIIAPNITSIIDIFNSKNYKGSIEELNQINELRGIPVKAGSTTSEWVCLGIEDNERIRPLTNVDDMVKKMLWIKENPVKVSKMVERAYDWVLGNKWQNIVEQWDKLFQGQYKALQEERNIGEKFDKAGRNDPCPCGSGVKFKKCHGIISEAGGTASKIRDWLVEKGENKS